jgi:hypothetical protein
MNRKSSSLAAGPIGLAICASLFGTGAVVLFGAWAVYFWFQADAPSVPLGLFWFTVGLAIPTAAELSRRRGIRRGEGRRGLVVLVSVTTLCAAGTELALVFVVYAASAYLGL